MGAVSMAAVVLGWLGTWWFELVLFLIVVASAVFVWRAATKGRTELRAIRTELSEMVELRTAERPVPNGETLESSLSALNVMLDRELRSIEALDRKAALVPTALGVTATVLLGQIDPGSFLKVRPVESGIVTLVLGLLSAASAAAVFYPRAHAIGAQPFMLARYSDEDPLRLKQALANELAYACGTVKGLNAVKAVYVYLALTLLVATVIAAVLFGVSGGFVDGK
jgi:hypothetical protein